VTEALPASPRSRIRDPRVWIGIVITVLAMAFALRGVDLPAVAAEFRRANLWILVGISVPSYLLVVALRALRWRHLTDPIAAIPRGALFRAVAVGFMANNVFPLRMGEFVRAWYLGRDTGTSGAAILGTVILERVLDTVMVIVLALIVISLAGGEDEATWRRGILLLVPVALAPIAALLWLHRAPHQVMGLATFLMRPMPEGPRVYVMEHLERFAAGLGALQGGTHLFWLAVHSLAIWLIASTLPMTAGFLALGVELGSVWNLTLASWMTLAAVGIAVALPSAPGFFGVYHSACRLVLVSFGLSPELAIALGTLLHAVFWVTLTTLGLIVLRVSHTSLGEIDAAAGG
jgi:uncharacterized protein (TIRG00374 family)